MVLTFLILNTAGLHIGMLAALYIVITTTVFGLLLEEQAMKSRSFKSPILRGNSWLNNAKNSRSACRTWYDATLALNNFSFRVVVRGVSRENMEDSEGQRLEQQT